MREAPRGGNNPINTCTKSDSKEGFFKKKKNGERTLTTVELDTGRRRRRVCLIEQLRLWCVTDFREGEKKIEEEEESDAGGVGFKGRAARWLTVGHWRDGEEERMGEEREEVGRG